MKKERKGGGVSSAAAFVSNSYLIPINPIYTSNPIY